MITYRNAQGGETELFELEGFLKLFYPHPEWGGSMCRLGVIGLNGADDAPHFYEPWGGDETDWSAAFTDHELLKFGWPWEDDEAAE